MELSTIIGSPETVESDALIIGRYRDGMTRAAEAVNKATNGELENWFKSGDASGCLGEASVFRNLPGVKAKRVVVVGLGKKCDGKKNFAPALLGALKAVYFAKNIAVAADDWCTDDKRWLAQNSATLFYESFHKQKDWKSNHKVAWKQPDSVGLLVCPCEEKPAAIEKAFADGIAIGQAVMLARELGDTPANICTPEYLAEKCISMGASVGFTTTVFDETALRNLKMGCILGVSSGSRQEARMVVMEYNGGNEDEAPIALVGKGLTFDAGGISLKPAKSMDEMKYDMSGAGSMIATMSAIAAMKLPVNVVAVIGCTENLPGSAAVKPGDVLTSYAGKTVEVLNTDAEGRLVLCDLLAYVIDKFKPKKVIDAATLTGACVVALGSEYTGLFSNSNELAGELQKAAENTLDKCWRLPLDPAYTKMLKTPFADLANIGAPGAGACTAAAFLQEFVCETPWAHLDIAGTAWKSGENKGSTGRPVPLLIDFLKNS